MLLFSILSTLFSEIMIKFVLQAALRFPATRRYILELSKKLNLSAFYQQKIAVRYEELWKLVLLFVRNSY